MTINRHDFCFPFAILDSLDFVSVLVSAYFFFYILEKIVAMSSEDFEYALEDSSDESNDEWQTDSSGDSSDDVSPLSKDGMTKFAHRMIVFH